MTDQRKNSTLISEELNDRFYKVAPVARAYQAAKIKSRLYGRATSKLRAAHAEEFKQLFEAEVTAYVEEMERGHG